MRIRPLLAPVAAAAILVGLAGCSASVSTGRKVGTGELEKQVSAFVTKQLDAKPSKVDCPDKVDAKAKATTLCTLTVKGVSTTVRLTVTKVDGGKATFDVTEVNADGSPLTTTTTEAPDTAPDETTTTAGSDTTEPGQVPSVAPAELEAKLKAGLLQEVGREPDSATCPEALQGVVGATTTCVITDGDQSYDVLLTVNTVDGLDVNFNFKVSETAN
ncbi:DUF4333 domain-containing protein [Aquihabitans sp. G128]|uniref:DUF4333 domain-containing protein n=1 Tax=Aquihabitans sp. G128 TaxID=2849779 RepID=UPI001C210847|nr:DUF4333 domain-containing protein [Aquihabitans sp. G128]QXC63192.1 DUF4333 domain-containing protein [Aquihabitans sp. G128]